MGFCICVAPSSSTRNHSVSNASTAKDQLKLGQKSDKSNDLLDEIIIGP